MASIFRIPLIAVPQRFTIELDGKPFIFEYRWNEEQPAWEFSLSDAETNEPLIACLPMVAGANLLRQHRHLGFKGRLVVFTDGDDFAPPSETNLGAEANLYYVVP